MLYIMEHVLSTFQWIRGQIELPSPRETTTYYLYSGEYPTVDWQSFINWVYDLRIGLQEFVFLSILIYLCILFYRKIKYPFWNIQPVLHDYDIFSRWIWKTPRIICKSPVKLKYYNRVSSTQILKTESADTMSREMATNISHFLRENWIPSDRILSTIIEKNLFALFVGHEYKSFYTILLANKIGNETSSNDIATQKIEGVMITHPATIFQRGDGYQSQEHVEKLATYIVDYIATLRDDTPDKIHALFQTHEYNQRIIQPSIATILFKKEVVGCDSLVSFIEYECGLYYLRLFMKLPILPAHFQIVEIEHRVNADILHNLFERKYILNTFKISILNSVPNLFALIKNKQLRVFCLKRKEDIFAFYFFRDPYLFYEDLNGKQLDLVASFINTEDLDLAYHGFLYSLRQILKEKKLDDLYNVLQIHGLGHNQILEEKWRQHHTKILETKIRYYLYNYIYSSVDKKSVFIL